MIHPLVPFAIRGITWYQGEQNNGDGMLYFDKMQALIQSWRNVFLRPDAPFYFVQIAPYRYGGGMERALPLALGGPERRSGHSPHRHGRHLGRRPPQLDTIPATSKTLGNASRSGLSPRTTARKTSSTPVPSTNRWLSKAARFACVSTIPEAGSPRARQEPSTGF